MFASPEPLARFRLDSRAILRLGGPLLVNNLVLADGTTDPEALAQLERILAALEIETSWAAAIADWVDEDTQPGFPDGAALAPWASTLTQAKWAALGVALVLVVAGRGGLRGAA